MIVAIVGCGFVADYYMTTFSLYPELKLAGVMDRDNIRAKVFAEHYSLPVYPSLEALINDKSVDIVINLTNPDNHFAVSKACLEAGKNVYTEKPLSTNIDEARQLVSLAEMKGLYICSAPCGLLGEAAQTVWKGLRENVVGKVRLVYAELNDGMVHQMPYKKWISASGAPWPYQYEFKIGCTMEHASYYLSWLVAFFGPALTVSAFSSCVVPDKNTGVLFNKNPDFSVACIKFSSGVVARLTCSIIAPHDNSLRIIGDDGILGIKECWNYRSPVFLTKRIITFGRKTYFNPFKQHLPLLGRKLYKSDYRTGWSPLRMDFCRGIADLGEAIREGRSPRLSASFSLHLNEVVLAIQNASENSSTYDVTSTFQPVEPMTWAKV